MQLNLNPQLVWFSRKNITKFKWRPAKNFRFSCLSVWVFLALFISLNLTSYENFPCLFFVFQDALTDLTGDSERLPVEEQHGTWLGHKV